MFSKTLTSEQFEKLFHLLGYRLTPSHKSYRIFENPEFDAVQLLPPAGKEPYARLGHLQTLRKISIEKGIVDEETFDRYLAEVQKPAEEPEIARSAA